MLLNIHHNGPAAIWGMLEMLRYGVVFLLPPIERSLTLKACCVIWVCFVWVIVEACVR
jgi:hypothetical protein